MEYMLFKEWVQDEKGNRIPRSWSYILAPLDEWLGILLRDDNWQVSRYVVPFTKKKKNVKSKTKIKSQ